MSAPRGRKDAECEGEKRGIIPPSAGLLFRGDDALGQGLIQDVWLEGAQFHEDDIV